MAIPVSRFGSRFKVGPLVAPGARVAVSVIHVAPGGLVAAHEAAARQLFAVVTGSGWVSGEERRVRSIRTGYAALWEPREVHEAGSAPGLTAVCIEGEFDTTALVVTADIVVSEYDPDWIGFFEQVRAHAWPAVSDIALRIEHVGSTAVPGLAAKPIIDADVVVPTEADVARVIERLATIGYRWRGDLGVVGREAFSAPEDTDLPAHHLYAVVENNKAHVDHWLLRDVLRADAVAREQYARLKRTNVDIADGDMDVYVAAKADFVADLLISARLERGLPAEEYWRPGSPG